MKAGRGLDGIKIFGDSHAHYFKITPDVRQYYQDNLKGGPVSRIVLGEGSVMVKQFDGASIIGLGRRESTLGTNDTIMRSVGPGDYVLLCFGQVDIELGFYYRVFVKREQITIDEFADRLISGYRKFIGELLPVSWKVGVKSANPPVLITHSKAVRYTSRIITENIQSPEEIRALTGQLAESLPGIEERAMNIKNFNDKLRTMADGAGLDYIDTWTEFSDPATGISREHFIPAGFDCHIVDSLSVRKKHWAMLLRAVRNSIKPEVRHE